MEDQRRLTFLPLATAGGRPLHEILRRVPAPRGTAAGFRAVGRRRAAARSGEEGEIPHAGALPDGAIGKMHAEEFHAAVRARPGIVAIVVAVGAPPRHLPAARRFLHVRTRSRITNPEKKNSG